MRLPTIPIPRRAVMAVGALSLVGGTALLAQVDPPTGPCFDVPELGVVVCQADAVTTTTVAATTTTAAPTTTTAAPTTTTAAPTTTAPATTTTVIPDTPIPATLPYGPFRKENAYRFEITNTVTEHPWWNAPYHFNLPYHADYGWAAGDRLGYRCIWGPLIDTSDLTLAETSPGGPWDWNGYGLPVGRFAAVRVIDEDTAAYITVNDRFMREGQRTWEGDYVAGGGQTEHPSFCQNTILTDDYEPYTGPDQRWLIVFRNPAGEVIEIRDYRNTVAHDEVKFHAVDADGTDGTVAIAAYNRFDNLPGVIVYYYGLNGGTVEAILP